MLLEALVIMALNWRLPSFGLSLSMGSVNLHFAPNVTYAAQPQEQRK